MVIKGWVNQGQMPKDIVHRLPKKRGKQSAGQPETVEASPADGQSLAQQPAGQAGSPSSAEVQPAKRRRVASAAAAQAENTQAPAALQGQQFVDLTDEQHPAQAQPAGESMAAAPAAAQQPAAKHVLVLGPEWGGQPMAGPPSPAAAAAGHAGAQPRRTQPSPTQQHAAAQPSADTQPSGSTQPPKRRRVAGAPADAPAECMQASAVQTGNQADILDDVQPLSDAPDSPTSDAYSTHSEQDPSSADTHSGSDFGK